MKTQNLNTASELKAVITELKAGRTLKVIKKEDKKIYYKIQSLTEKMGELKARENGNFITKEHLTEFKGLIIWYLKNKCNYRGLLNMKSAMVAMLKAVEAKQYIFKTERGIKSEIYNITRAHGMEQMRKDFYEFESIDILTDNTLNNVEMSKFQSWSLDMMMN